MSRNGSGTYILPVGNPVVTGTTISSNWANTTLSDMATALTGSVAADGQTPVTGNIQMGNNKITGMANGTALTDAATVGQAVPSGAILMWSGSIATIPTGWLICDGTNGTPDLRSKFIVGAGSTYAVNATGGTADAIVVSHTHTASTGGQSATHTHGLTAPAIATFGATSYTIGGSLNALYGTTSVDGTNPASNDHTHAVTVDSAGASGTNANLPPYLALAYIMKA
jgi:microcystin-dependent protein